MSRMILNDKETASRELRSKLFILSNHFLTFFSIFSLGVFFTFPDSVRSNFREIAVTKIQKILDFTNEFFYWLGNFLVVFDTVFPAIYKL